MVEFEKDLMINDAIHEHRRYLNSFQEYLSACINAHTDCTFQRNSGLQTQKHIRRSRTLGPSPFNCSFCGDDLI